MRSRDATATINGFRYQFLRTIEALLDAPAEASVTVEGIEDIDIVTSKNTELLQCKYYEETSHAQYLLKKPITYILVHFAENKNFDVKYHIFLHK